MPPDPQPTIEITGPGEPPRRQIINGAVLIGRSPEIGFRLSHPSVSRRHAELLLDQAGRWILRDLGSRNGTYVNGVRAAEHLLQNGDIIVIGEFSLRWIFNPRNHTPPVWTPPDDAPGSIITSLRTIEPPRVSAALISIVLEFGQTLARISDRAERLQRLVSLPIGAEVGAWWCHALAVKETSHDHGGLELASLCEPLSSPAGVAREPHVSRTVLRSVLDTNGPVIANNLLRPTKFEAAMTMGANTDATAAVACPMDEITGLVGSRSARVLYVTLPPLIASLEWLALISFAVQQFRNAELSWAAREADLSRAAVEREMAWARELQAHTLPRHDPGNFAGIDWDLRFEPCLAVGGDYADVIHRRDGRLLLVVADVSGKGMRAALIASKVHTIFNADDSGSSLTDLLTAANRHLCRVLPDVSFVTLVAILIDPATGEGTSINCGHPPPIVISQSGAIRDLHEGETYPLGIDETEIYSAVPFKLAPDEWVVLYTDGITEMFNPRGELLGSEAFADSLTSIYKQYQPPTAEAYAAHVRGYLDNYRGDAVANDDLTLLLFKCGSTQE